MGQRSSSPGSSVQCRFEWAGGRSASRPSLAQPLVSARCSSKKCKYKHVGNNPRAPDLHREWDSSVKRAGKPPVFSGHESDWHTYASSFHTWAQTAGVEHVFNQAYNFPQAGHNWRGTRATDEVVRLEVEKVKFCYNTLNQSMKGRLRRDKGR